MIDVIDQMTSDQAGKEQLVNELFDALRAKFTLTIHRSASIGLTLALYGGPFQGNELIGQTLTLPASSTRYIEATVATGVIYGTASAFTSGRIPLGVAITNTTGITSYTPVDRENWSAAVSGVAQLGAVNVFTKNQSVTPVALTDTSSIATDASLSNNFTVTLGGNRTLANPTNLTDGMWLHWRIKQDGTGSRTLAYGSAFKWPGGSTPALSTAANAIDTVSAYCDGTILLANINKAYA